MKHITGIALVVISGLLSELSVWAVDGVILVDQNRALAGSITPGDTPGFPITINQPGSYQLSGNIRVPQGVSGIEITSDHVTLNLNGFTISGTGRTEGAAAIKSSGVNDVSVLNGTVTGMERGVSLSNIKDARVDRVRAVDNVTVGIVVVGYGTVSNCTVSNNGRGLVIENIINRDQITTASSLLYNQANNNGEDGFEIVCPGTNLIGNTATGNGGLDLRMTGDRCRINADNLFLTSSLGELSSQGAHQ